MPDSLRVARNGVLSGNFLANDTDPDPEDRGRLGLVIVSHTLLGRNFDPDVAGAFTYKPKEGFQGTRCVWYYAVDPRGARSNVTTATIVVGQPKQQRCPPPPVPTRPAQPGGRTPGQGTAPPTSGMDKVKASGKTDSRSLKGLPWKGTYDRDARCSGEGGNFGRGWAYAKAHIYEYGKSGTEYFKLIFLIKYLGVDNEWHVQTRQVFKSTPFVDDVRDYAWGIWHTMHYGPDWIGSKALVLRYEWWNDRPVIKDKLVYWAELEAARCDAGDIEG